MNGENQVEMKILRDVGESDLDTFFIQQLDPEAIYMAAFTTADPTDRANFDAHWQRIRNNANIVLKTIVVNGVTNGQVAGYIASFEQFGEREVSYWLGKEFWGQGIATRALAEFLEIDPIRPLHGRTAKDNVASVRVLQKCGFVITGENKDFANGRGAETEEYILVLGQ
jgi:RimJ/RimL family protein N-acetyltransferase